MSRYGPWPDYLMPGPIAVGQALADGVRNGLFVRGAVVSLLRLLVGYGISLVGGVVLGTLLVRYKALRDTVGTLIVGLQALPSVCWLPLAILWFGLNERAIIFVVVMGSLFSIVLGVRDGIAQHVADLREGGAQPRCRLACGSTRRSCCRPPSRPSSPASSRAGPSRGGR